MEDPNPYRRNYMLCSIGILLYFVGGGHLLTSGEEAEIAIGIINIGLSRPWVLAMFAFLMWFWSAFRYVQKCPDPHDERVFDFFVAANKATAVKPRFIGLLGDQRGRLAIRGDVFRSKAYDAKLGVYGPFRSSSTDRQVFDSIYTMKPSRYIELSRGEFEDIRKEVRANVVIKEHATADWWFPHILAGIAAWSVLLCGIPWGLLWGVVKLGVSLLS